VDDKNAECFIRVDRFAAENFVMLKSFTKCGFWRTVR